MMLVGRQLSSAPPHHVLPAPLKSFLQNKILFAISHLKINKIHKKKEPAQAWDWQDRQDSGGHPLSCHLTQETASPPSASSWPLPASGSVLETSQ